MSDQHNFMVFAALPSFSVIDNAVFVDGQWLSSYTRQTQEQLAEQYGEVCMMGIRECTAGREAFVITEAKEIDQTRYMDMLEVLPPLDFVNTGRTSSFKMSEMYSGNITTIFVRVAGRYFEFKDRVTLTHSEILSRVLEHVTAQDAAKECEATAHD